MQKKMGKEKFQFDADFQQEILQLTVTDLKRGFKVIQLYEDHYFSLIEHTIIAHTLKSFWKKKKRVPSKTVLKEELKITYKLRDFREVLTDKDINRVNKIVNKIYASAVKDPSDIYEGCKRFAQFIAFKEEVEKIDITDFTQYESYHKKIHKAITIGANLEDEKGTFIVADAKARVETRHNTPPSHPTPFWQLNRLMNNGGTTVGNVITVMGPAKRFKTGFILNLAKGYLRLRKKVLIADFENGEASLGMRFDQSVLSLDRKDTASGQFDEKLLKTYRKYKRIGAELIIKRFRSGETAQHIERYMEQLHAEYGIEITDLIVDYADVMGATSGEKDDVRRISDAYLDLKNLGDTRKLHSIWTPSHVTREGGKNQKKKFEANDVAKNIDKIRHADIILGVNQDEDEKEQGVLRIEIVEQRDGKQEGRAYFWVNMDQQKLTEFNKEQVKHIEEERESRGEDAPKNTRVKGNPNSLSDV